MEVLIACYICVLELVHCLGQAVRLRKSSIEID